MNIKEILKSTNFKFNKALGQNFITDNNLLDAIVVDSGVCEDDIVVEIGTGAGTLTKALSKKAKKVYSFEVDTNLKEVLALTLQGCENVEVIFKDILKLKDDEFKEIVQGKFKVVANLPYYITTPLIMRFLESDLDIQSLTIMVQKEVADRFVASSNTSDYSAITLSIQMCADAKITRIVSKNMFFPVPKVDSAVVKIDVDRQKLVGNDEKLLKKIIRSAFAMRRKTLSNNLSGVFNISKADLGIMFEKLGYNSFIRGEALSLDDYIKLSKLIEDYKKI